MAQRADEVESDFQPERSRKLSPRQGALLPSEKRLDLEDESWLDIPVRRKLFLPSKVLTNTSL